LFYQNLALEVQARGEAKVLVRRTSVAVDAAMAASSVGINAGIEADIGTVVPGDDRTRNVSQVDRFRARLLSIELSGSGSTSIFSKRFLGFPAAPRPTILDLGPSPAFISRF
jgi:hypothetical protein